MNWPIIVGIVLFARFGFSNPNEEYYEVRTYDVEEGSKIIYPIPMSVLRKNNQEACWKGEPPLVTVCCFGTSIPARGQSACYRDHEYDIEKHDPSVYFEIYARAKEATLYYLKIPYSALYVCFYLIEVGALNEDKYNVISALRYNVIGQINATNAASTFTFNYFCPNKFIHKLNVVIHPGGTSVHAYNGHASKDPAYTHYRAEIFSEKDDDYIQIFAYCDYNYSIPVITNIKWTNKPIYDIQHTDSPLLQLIENVTLDMYTTIPLSVDKSKSGINSTCYVTSGTRKVYWSEFLHYPHFFVQFTDNKYNTPCKKCKAWYIPGEKPSDPSRFVLLYKPDPEEIYQLFCMTYTQNFYPFFHIFGSAEITGKREEVYDMLRFNSLKRTFIRTSEILELRFYYPISKSVDILVRTNKSRDEFKSIYSEAKFIYYDTKYSCLMIIREYRGFSDEQYLLIIKKYEVDLIQNVHWTPSNEEEDNEEEEEGEEEKEEREGEEDREKDTEKSGEQTTNPTLGTGLSLSGKMIELIPDVILQVSDDDKLAIKITMLCIAGIAASYAVAIFYLFFFGFQRFDEDMKPEAEDEVVEMEEEINDDTMAENISEVDVAADDNAEGKNEGEKSRSLFCLRRQKKAEYRADNGAVNEEKSTKSSELKSVEINEISSKIEKVKAE